MNTITGLNSFSSNPWSVYSADSLKSVMKNGSEPEKLKKVASEFETHFINLLLQTMRKTIPKSDFLHTMKGEDSYYYIHDYEIAKEISKRQGIGLGALLLKELGGAEQDKPDFK